MPTAGAGQGGTAGLSGGSGSRGSSIAGQSGETTGGTPSAGAGGTSISGQAGVATCVPTTWYLDGDHDGFGAAAYRETACTAPSGFVADATDCYDGNRDAHPGQLEWFSIDRGDGSFDYDCSGSAELRYPTFSPCPELDNSCPPPNRWPAGFTCDYLGMTAAYQKEDGWKLYSYDVCPPEPCTVAVVKLPDCGEVGRYGKPGLGWDVGTSEYTCDEMPNLSDYEIGFLPKRTQTCR